METIQGSEPRMPDPDKSYPVTVLGYPAEIIGPKETYEKVSEQIAGIPLKHPHPKFWLFSFAIAFSFFLLFCGAVSYLLYRGVGIWGINIPVAWGFAITNFVWWIGIGHAGTFISAILLLLHQKWRTTINRFTEAMTLFAVTCAGMFPLLHLGRPWVFFWLLPYPDTMALWPQFRSPLVWDVFAVSTYFLVSLMFWYLGVMPDLATVRDKAKAKWKKILYGLGAMGWRGSALHWQRHQSAYLLLGGLATPLVLSVHSVVSFDFAVSQLPGWHSTIFPPYFVAGAIYSGFAMVLNLLIPIRRLYGLQNLITTRTLNNMACVTLATCWMVTYGYTMEAFTAWYSNDVFERQIMWDRAFGAYGWIFWILIMANCVIPQLLWSRRVRTNDLALFFVALSANVGMWIERFVIVVQSLHHDFVPSSWAMFIPTKWDVITLLGSIGLFLMLLLLFIRYIPMISISESRELDRATQGGPVVIQEKSTVTVLPEPPIEYEEKALFGLMAEFEEHEQLLAAARRAFAEGYRRMDGYSPFPIEGLAEALGHEHTPVPLFALIGGIVGGLGGYFMEWYSMARLYPLNIGGRPYNSWPNFIPVTFELTVLVASVSAFLAVFILNRLPHPHHPVFNVPEFERASIDRFFLCVEVVDPKFKLEETRKFLESLQAYKITEVFE